MTRKLPWLDKGAKSLGKQKSGATTVKESKIRSIDSNDDLPTSTPPRPSRKGKERAEPISSSPISSPPDQDPPKTEYMRQGLDADDSWMMVEDEFLQTAKLFTRRLHLAEYQRLKALPARKNVTRPVVPDAKPSKETQMRMKADALSKSQKKALQAASASSDEEESADDLDLPVRGVSSRATSKLSARPTERKSSPLSSNRKITSITPGPTRDARPTKSASKARSSNASSEENSLDIVSPTKASIANSPQAKPTSTTRSAQTSASHHTKPTPAPLDRPAQSPTKPSEPSRWKSRIGGAPPTSRFSFFDDFDAPRPQTQSSESAARMAKRKAEREKKEQEEKKKRKSLKLDEIPTFLF